jgi:hypothetical protein
LRKILAKTNADTINIIMKTYREFLATKMENAPAPQQGDYGNTGDPNYPYHPEYGQDPYYPSKGSINDEKMQELFQAANTGMGSIMQFLMALTQKSGDTRYMQIWDNFNKGLHQAGLYGFGTHRRNPYGKSIFRR